MRDRYLVLLALSLLLAVMEFVDAFFIDATAFAIGYSVVVAGLGVLAWQRRTRWPAIVLAVLAGLELAMVLLVYPGSEDPPQAWNTAAFAVVTLATAVAAVVVAASGRSRQVAVS